MKRYKSVPQPRSPSTWRTGSAPGPRLRADATSWVMRDPDGQLKRVAVVDMTDAHVARWIQYFRRKWRDSGFLGTEAELDAVIRASIVTARAIYAEAAKRQLPITEIAAAPQQVSLADTDLLRRFIREMERSERTFAHAVLRFANAVRFHAAARQVQIEFSQARETLYYLCVSKVPQMATVATRVWSMPVNVVVTLSVAACPVAPVLEVQPALSEAPETRGMRRITFED